MNEENKPDFQLIRVGLKNILSFEDAVFDNIGQLAVIIGSNNSGKSNFFRVLLGLQEFFNDTGQPFTKEFFFGDIDPGKAEIILQFKVSEKKINEYLGRVLRSKVSLEEMKRIRIKWKGINWINGCTFIANLALKLTFKSDPKRTGGRAFISEAGFWKENTIINLIHYNDFNKPDLYLKDIPWQQLSQPPGSSTMDLFFDWENASVSPSKHFDFTNQFLGNGPEIHSSVSLSFFSECLSKFFDNLKYVKEHRNFEKQDFLSDIGDETQERFTENISSDGHNFSRIFSHYWANVQDKKEDLNKLLHEFYPQIQELSQVSDFSNNQTIPRLKEYNLPNFIGFDHVGKGMHQVLIILTHLIQLQPEDTLFIEEPELFIHPELQKQLLTVFQRYLPSHQIIFTTHSPFFLDNLPENHSIHLVRRISGAASVQTLTKEECGPIFDELGIRASDFLLYNGVILFEGTKDIQLFKEILGDFLIKNHLEVVPYFGKTTPILSADYHLIQNFISKGIKFLVVLDRDEGNQGPIKKIPEELQKFVLRLPVREVENFFLGPDILAEFLSTHYNERFTEITAAKKYIEQGLAAAINENIKWETKVKAFFDQYFSSISQKEREEFLTPKKREDWFTELFAFLKERNHCKELDEVFFKGAFEKIEQDINQKYASEPWKVCPGKKVRKIIADRCQQDGITLDFNVIKDILQKKSVILQEFVGTIQSHFTTKPN